MVLTVRVLCVGQRVYVGRGRKSRPQIHYGFGLYLCLNRLFELRVTRCKESVTGITQGTKVFESVVSLTHDMTGLCHR